MIPLEEIKARAEANQGNRDASETETVDVFKLVGAVEALESLAKSQPRIQLYGGATAGGFISADHILAIITEALK